VCKDIENDPTGRTRLFLPVKNNIGNDADGLAYSLEARFSPNGQPVVSWSPEPVHRSADDVLASRGARKDGTVDSAKEWLQGALAEGPRGSSKLFSAARKDGIAKSALYRAKAALGIKSEKRAFSGGWLWALSKTTTKSEEEAN